MAAPALFAASQRRRCCCAPLLFALLLALTSATTPCSVPSDPPPPPAPACIGLNGQLVDWWIVLKHPGGHNYSYLAADRCSGRQPQSPPPCAWQHGLTLDPDGGPPSKTLAVLRAAAPGPSGSSGADTGGADPPPPTTTPIPTPTPARAPSPAIAHAMWNDDDPGGEEHWEAAHSKGVAAFDASGRGFWLQHSVPRWPAAPGADGFDRIQRAQTVFAQHLACFSFSNSSDSSSGGSDGDGSDGDSSDGDGSAVRALGRLLLAAGPHIHSAHLPAAAAAAFPEWAALTNPRRGPSGSTEAVVERGMRTAGGVPLLAFAKPPLLNVSLLDAIVAPALFASPPSPSTPPQQQQQQRQQQQDYWQISRSLLRSPARSPLQSAHQRTAAAAAAAAGEIMMWETWRRSADALPSLCPPHVYPPPAEPLPSALNVAALKFPGPGAPRWGWQRDHSKWGVSSSIGGGGALSGSRHVVCLCDLNRSVWQAHRGGACVCLPGREDVWGAFSGAIESVEPCVKRRGGGGWTEE